MKMKVLFVNVFHQIVDKEKNEIQFSSYFFFFNLYYNIYYSCYLLLVNSV